MKKIIIVGAGASGVFLALNLKNKDNEIILLEKNDTPLKKLSMTGNGRCNYYNDDQNIKHYHSESLNELNYLLKEKDIKRCLELFNELGIYPRIINGYYYPYSNNAKTIRNTLIEELNKKKIKLKLNYEVNNIKKKGNKFIINNDLTSDYLVISTGSKCMVNDYIMYDILKEMKIDIIKPLPGLTKLVVDNKYLNKLNGIRTLCKASIIVNDEVIKEEEGELQLTNYGLSGIVIFNLSRYASINLEKNNNVKVKINFLHTIQNIEEIFVKNNNIKSALNRILDEKLVNVLLKDLKNLNYNELTKEEKNELFKILTEYEFIVTGIKDFNNCQVSVGGVSLNEVDLKSLESLKISNLYFTGEILDVDGDCGGYNLTFAWLSALIVSRSIRRKNDKSK